MSDKDNFTSIDTKLTPNKLNELWTALQTARTNRGWSNGTWTAPTEVKYKRTATASATQLNALKDLVHYNNQGPRYVNNFPAYTIGSSQLFRSNFINEIQLAINDISHGVGCSSGCTGICVGCTNACSGSTCTGTCGTQCSGGCGAGCTSVCANGCGGSCATGCSGCKAACRGGTE